MTAGARLGRVVASGLTDPAEVSPGQVAEARKELGRQLAARREAAGLTQTELARRVAYSRSSVANVEAGSRSITPGFWQNADRELDAAGALLAASDDLDRMVQAERICKTQQLLDQLRQQPAGSAVPGCGCELVVGRWTGRETRALREALRMSMRVFADYLGVTTSTVSGWESNDTAPLRLASQAVLDQALKLADADAKTRFGLILDSDADCACGAGGSGAGSVAGGSVVTPLRQPGRTRTAS
jgi:transcriptional regulator with XRE-family HTH domain